MTIFKLTSFCGCISLRAGALLIGYLQLLFQLYVSAWIIWNLWDAIYNSAKVYRFGVPIEFYLILIVAFSFIVFTMSLLYGVHRRTKGPIKTYLIYMAFFLLILFTIRDEESSFDYLFLKNSYLMILMFFWLVITSYYYQMDELETANSKISNV